jgi:hypothetical protein
MVTLGLQGCDLVSPARAIGPYTVDKNDGRFSLSVVCALAPVVRIKVESSRIDLNFDVFMILGFTFYLSAKISSGFLAEE